MHESNQLSEKEAKERLEALFSGGEAPVPPSGPASGPKTSGSVPTLKPGFGAPGTTRKVFANPRKSIGRAPSEFRMRVERIRISRSPEEIEEATNHFLAHHQLPDDPDILMKVLQHSEESVLREAMGQLSSLMMQGRWTATFLLEDRLSELDGRVTEPGTISFIEGLRAQLANLKN